MFDASYFRSILARDVEAAGAEPVVEIHVRNGATFRVHSVVDAGDDRLTLSAYHSRAEFTHHRPYFVGDAKAEGAPAERFRAVLAYEAIVAVVIDPATQSSRHTPGFLAQ